MVCLLDNPGADVCPMVVTRRDRPETADNQERADERQRDRRGMSHAQR